MLCLYEDGTQARWLPGKGDCPQGFTTCASRMAGHVAAHSPDLPRAVREHLATRAACAEIGWKRAPDLAGDRFR